MSRPVYQLDTENVDYEKVGDMTFRFRGDPQLIAMFKNPKTIIQGRTRGFAVEWFRIIPGPLVDGELLFEVKLEQLT